MRRGNTGKLVAAGGGVAVIVALVALFGELRGPGRGGSGTGTGAGPENGTSDRRDNAGDVRMTVMPGRMVASPTTGPTTQPAAGPLKITVEGNDYLVDGRRRSLDEVRQLLQSKAQAESGAVVEVDRRPNARAKAEEDLKAELEKLPLKVAATPPW
jgi:hypothetical protein